MRFMNCKGDEDIDAKRSRPSIGKPASGHASKERVLLIGTGQRITSGPAATMAAFRGRIRQRPWSANNQGSRPDRSRGPQHAQRSYEHYLALAEAEARAGNSIAAENY